MLMAQGIDVPVHVFVNRDSPDGVDDNIIEEFDEVCVDLFSVFRLRDVNVCNLSTS
jgi:hypothetical protein